LFCPPPPAGPPFTFFFSPPVLFRRNRTARPAGAPPRAPEKFFWGFPKTLVFPPSKDKNLRQKKLPKNKKGPRKPAWDQGGGAPQKPVSPLETKKFGKRVCRACPDHGWAPARPPRPPPLLPSPLVAAPDWAKIFLFNGLVWQARRPRPPAAPAGRILRGRPPRGGNSFFFAGSCNPGKRAFFFFFFFFVFEAGAKKKKKNRKKFFFFFGGRPPVEPISGTGGPRHVFKSSPVGGGFRISIRPKP